MGNASVCSRSTEDVPRVCIGNCQSSGVSEAKGRSNSSRERLQVGSAAKGSLGGNRQQVNLVTLLVTSRMPRLSLSERAQASYHEAHSLTKRAEVRGFGEDRAMKKPSVKRLPRAIGRSTSVTEVEPYED